MLRRVAFATLRYSGLPFVVRELFQRSKVTIVVYHALGADRAHDHFRALAAHYHVIGLADYLRARRQGTVKRLPRKALIITLDDGHRINVQLARILEQMRLPMTIFLCSGIVGTNRHYWWTHTSSSAEAQALKRTGDAERLAALLARGYQPDKEYPDRQALSWTEIAQLQPWVDFQAHTVTHPILTACAEAKADQEIRGSTAALAVRLGQPVEAIAFPNGDYSDREIDLARKAGCTCALTLDPGFNDAQTDLFRLRRIPLPDDASVSEVLVKSSGLWNVLRRGWRAVFRGSRH